MNNPVFVDEEIIKPLSIEEAEELLTLEPPNEANDAKIDLIMSIIHAQSWISANSLDPQDCDFSIDVYESPDKPVAHSIEDLPPKTFRCYDEIIAMEEQERLRKKAGNLALPMTGLDLTIFSNPSWGTSRHGLYSATLNFGMNRAKPQSIYRQLDLQCMLKPEIFSGIKQTNKTIQKDAKKSTSQLFEGLSKVGEFVGHFLNELICTLCFRLTG